MTKRAAPIIAGVLVIGMALFGSRIGLAYGVQPFSSGQIVFLLMGVVLILIGIRDGKQTVLRLTKLSQTISGLLLGVIMTILVLEIVSSLILNALTLLRSPSNHSLDK